MMYQKMVLGPNLIFFLLLSKRAAKVNICVNYFTLFKILELDICLVNATLNVAK